VVAQYKNDVFYVFDEVRLANSNTRAALDVLVAKFGSMARLLSILDSVGIRKPHDTAKRMGEQNSPIDFG
jgi:hypothetical protein